MTKTIKLSEFEKLPLEKRAKIALKHYYTDEINIEDDIFSIHPFLESWGYLEKNKYIKLKQFQTAINLGEAFNITKYGYEFIREKD